VRVDNVERGVERRLAFDGAFVTVPVLRAGPFRDSGVPAGVPAPGVMWSVLPGRGSVPTRS
ncbi:MAG: hypothetical protein M0Z62_09285, partial [Actinomycetota bacterium]|nr:hypothetical protein [Actinomycetota bacterium]